ncbi:MAG: heavy metal translocating P-type ATPase, partial [Selenomonadaceae bacterium]|nr:heavy metal translocating P-type ATPase [Selenomonadaceae bacterium]
MSSKQRKKFLRIIAATILMISLEFLKVEGATKFFCYMIPYFIVGYDILFKAAKSLRKLNALDENFLMAFASIGAIALSFFGEENFTEAVAVILFYQVGELFESYAVGKSRKNISELMDIRPDYAIIENFGKIERVDPD